MKKFLALFLASAISVMAAPTQPSTPILNGKLLNNLNANGFRIDALDTSNLNLGGGGGTPLTDLTLNTPIVLFSSAAVNFNIVGGSVAGTMTLHTQAAGTIFSNLSGSTATPIWNDLAAFKSAAALNLLDNTSDASKPISTATQTALDTKELISTHNSDLSAANAAIALKASTTDVNAGLSLKADSADVSVGLALKQNTLPTTSNDGWILARHNGGGAFFFVDPVSLGGGGGGGGGSGTVTDFSIINNVPQLFTAAVSNSTVTPQLTLTTTTTTAANTFYGNATNFAGAAGFMNAAAARSSLGANTVGSALITLANPSAIRYMKINASNGIDLETSAGFLAGLGGEFSLGNPVSNGQVLSSNTVGTRSWVSKENPLTFSTPLGRTGDTISMPAAGVAANGYLTIGDWTAFNAKESALTFTAPLSRSGNAISIPAASTSVTGYLLSTDWTTFNNKAPSTRTISTTAPITGGGDLSTNRTFAMAAAGSSADGYLTSANWTLFNSKASGDSEVILTNTGGTTGSPATWTTGASTAKETVALTASKFILLPPANAYQAGRRLYYFDSVTTLNFGRSFRRQGGDTLNGGAVDIQPFIAGSAGYGGSKTATFETDGTSAWRILSSGTVDHVENPIDATQSFGFDASAQLNGIRGSVLAGQGNTVTVNPTLGLGIPGVVTDVATNGLLVKTVQHPADVVPTEYIIGQVGGTIAANAVFTVTNGAGTIDKVRIQGSLSGPITIKWPDANTYSSGQDVVLIDDSGTVSGFNQVSITSNSGNLFSGASSALFDEANGRKALTSDASTNWSIPTAKTSIKGYAVITPTGGNVFTIPTDSNVVQQNATLNLVNGANVLSIPNPTDGMNIELVLVQPASGAAGTLSLPSVSSVALNGLGLVSLTATNGAVDVLKGRYVTALNQFLWNNTQTNYTTGALPTAPSALATSGITASKVDLTWTDNSSNETGFEIVRAAGLSGTSYSTIATTAANATTYTDSGVASGSPYNWKVRAINSAGASAYSSLASATTSAGGPTADIWEAHFNEGGTNTISNATTPSGGTIDLNYADWTSATQASAFAFNPTAGMLNTTGVTVTPTGGTAAGVTWAYRVVAFKGTLHNGNSIVSSAVGYATLTGSAFNRISWTSVTGATSYTIYRTTAGTTPSSVGQIATSIPQAGGTITFDDTGYVASPATPANIQTATDIHNAVAHTSVPFGVNQISISFWIKGSLSTTGTNGIVLTDLGNSSVKINYVSASKYQIVIPGGTGIATFTVPMSTTNNGSWHNVVITIDDSTSVATTADVKAYYDNGAAQTTTLVSTTKSGAFNFPTAKPTVGASPSAFAIDDVRIYGRILNSTEIGNLFGGNAQ